MTQLQPEVLIESNFENIEVLQEAEKGKDKKSWFINGVFLQSDIINRNRRIYPKAIMESEVGRYTKNFVLKNQGVGELNHPPPEQVGEIHPENIAYRIHAIEQEGNNFVGKGKVLNTPSGKIVQGLLEDDVRLGVSSRGRGSVKKNPQGIAEVQDDFRIIAIDVVFNPSAPDAFVNGLMEGRGYIWNTIDEDVEYIEEIKKDIKKAKSKSLQEAKITAFNNFLNLINKKI